MKQARSESSRSSSRKTAIAAGGGLPLAWAAGPLPPSPRRGNASKAGMEWLRAQKCPARDLVAAADRLARRACNGVKAAEWRSWFGEGGREC